MIRFSALCLFRSASGALSILALLGTGCAIKNPDFDDLSAGDDGSESSADESGEDVGEDSDSASGSASDTDTAGDGDGDGDGEECPAEARCSPLPEGWNGYAAIATGDLNSVGTCDDLINYPMSATSSLLVTEIIAWEESCTPCECAPEVGTDTCPDSFYFEAFASEAGCAGTTNSDQVFGGMVDTTCSGPFPVSVGSVVQDLFGQVDAGQADFNWVCEANPAEGIELGYVVQLCDAAPATVGASCGDGATPANCVVPPADQDLPSGFNGQICIWREAGEPGGCPEEYPVYYYGYDTLVDARECEACTCVQETPGECEVEVEVFAGSACSDTLSSASLLSSDPECDLMGWSGGTPDNIDGLSLQATVNDIVVGDAACTATAGGEPTADSDVFLTDKITICCDQ